MANTAINNGFFSSNISTYFSRPSKITKPVGSRNQSPRNRVGRRMTTHIPVRTTSVIDPQRSNVAVRQPTCPRSRPTSWHPALVNEYQQYQPFPMYFQPQQCDMYGNTTVNHGLPTPNSFPVVDEGFLDCPSIPLEYLNSQDQSTFPTALQHTGVYTDAPGNNQFLFTSATTNMFIDDSMGLTTAPWPYCAADLGHDIQTAPVSPDFLPLPEMGDEFNVSYIDEVPEKDELVGMGLYDSPADVQSNSLLFGGCLPVRRKSLKLEESFEPGPLSDEDAVSEAADQDDVSEAGSEFETEAAAIIPATHTSTQLSDMDQEVGMSGYRSYMAPGVSTSIYAGVPLWTDQQIPRWF